LAIFEIKEHVEGLIDRFRALWVIVECGSAPERVEETLFLTLSLGHIIRVVGHTVKCIVNTRSQLEVELARLRHVGQQPPKALIESRARDWARVKILARVQHTISFKRVVHWLGIARRRVTLLIGESTGDAVSESDAVEWGVGTVIFPTCVAQLQFLAPY